MNVIFRVRYDENIRKDECIALLPSMPSVRGYISYCTEDLKFGKMSIMQYHRGTKRAEPGQYFELYNALKAIYKEKGVSLTVRQSVVFADLRKAWNNTD